MTVEGATVRMSAQSALLAVTAAAAGRVDAASITSGLLGGRGALECVPARIWIPHLPATACVS